MAFGKARSLCSRFCLWAQRRPYAAITILFALTAALCFCWFPLTGKTFIWGSDGWHQHYKALAYYGDYLRGIVGNLIASNGLVIPTWAFSISEGSDVLTTLHYYVIGEPINLLAVLCPARWMWLLFCLLVLVRLYLAALAFVFMCRDTGRYSSVMGMLLGAITYAFCMWALLNVARHPYFLTPMIYLPLLIAGVERVFRKESPALFVAAAFLSTVSNFYFLYMLVILVLVYVAVRLVYLRIRGQRGGLKAFGRLALFALLGIGLGAAIFVPVAASMLGDSRTSVHQTFGLLYGLRHYLAMPGMFASTSNSNWLYMGYSAIALPALCLLFRKRKANGELKVLLVLALAVAALPILGSVLNGFSYATNRWCFALSLLVACAVARMWPELAKLSGKDAVFLLACLGVYFTYCFLVPESRNECVFVIVGLGAFLICGLYFLGGEGAHRLHAAGCLAVALVVVSVSCVALYKYDPAEDNYSGDCVSSGQIKTETAHSAAAAVKKAVKAGGGDVSQARFSGNMPRTDNSNMVKGVSSTQYYWSLSNPYANEFRSSLGCLSTSSYQYTGYDGRAALLSFSSVGYWAAKSSDSVPYGFAVLDGQSKKETYSVSENGNALPLAYGYSATLSRSDFEGLNEVEKQDALLGGLVLEDEDSVGADASASASSAIGGNAPQNLDYEISKASSGVSCQEGRFVVTKSNSQVTLAFKGAENAETYVLLHGLDYEPTMKLDLYLGSDEVDPDQNFGTKQWGKLSLYQKNEVLKQKLEYYGKDYARQTIGLKSDTGTSAKFLLRNSSEPWYNGRHNFTVPFGYNEEALQSVTITFPHAGVYSFSDIQVVAQPMEGFSEQVAQRAEHTLENIEVGTNQISGTFDSPSDSEWLMFAIPYSKGWTAYVDGRQVDIHRANIQYMAVQTGQGQHEVRLVYETPYLKLGLGISALSLVGLVLIAAARRATKGKGARHAA